eukprot:gene27589-7224_t
MPRIMPRSRVSTKVFAAKGFAAPAVSKDMLVPKNAPTVTKVEFEQPLSIVKYPDPRLRAMNSKIKAFDSSLMDLAKEMIRLMYEDDGVGLAAPQVGVNVRLMVFNPDGKTKPGNESILVNPVIVSCSSEITAIETEGCLSFPKLYALVGRPRDIVVQAQNEKGEDVKLELGGESEQGAWVSRIFQHEYDHLQGILFHDRMKKSEVDTIREGLLAQEAEWIAANPGVDVPMLDSPKPKKAEKKAPKNKK